MNSILQYDSKKLVGLIPSSNKIFYIIGIGGIGMSAIANVLHDHGAYVMGSDLVRNANISSLEDKGVKCHIGEHKAENISEANVVIYSTAVKADNPEMVYAQQNGMIILNRAQAVNHLIESSYNICISGMHGKTTTSSMMALMFECAQLKQLALIGGIMQYNNSNYIMHKNFQWAVVEADESDDTFIKIPTSIAVVTNISPEHLDYHLTFENIKNKFTKFINNIPFYGFAVVCIDDDQVLTLVSHASHDRVFTYGIEKFDANYYATNIKINAFNNMTFDVMHNESKARSSNKNQSRHLGNFELNIFGKFNISNALACIAVGNELRMPFEIMFKSIALFKSTKRRFEILGKLSGGKGCTVIDDYAHHPKEIDANIETALVLAAGQNGRLIVVLQPHRYSRLHKLLDSFGSCKLLDAYRVLLMPVYASNEVPIEGINSEALYHKLKNSSHCPEIDLIESYEHLHKKLIEISIEKDLILCMGAGSISEYAHKLCNK